MKKRNWYLQQPMHEVLLFLSQWLDDRKAKAKQRKRKPGAKVTEL